MRAGPRLLPMEGVVSKKLKSYTVQLRINVVTDYQIAAESLEQALQKALELKLDEVVDLPGDYIDGPGVVVLGVFDHASY